MIDSYHGVFHWLVGMQVAERDEGITALQQELTANAPAQEELTQLRGNLVLALTQAQTQAQVLKS